MIAERLSRRKNKTKSVKKKKNLLTNNKEVLMSISQILGEETTDSYRESAERMMEISKLVEEKTRIFLIDPTNYVDLRRKNYYTPEQNLAKAMISLSIHDYTKPVPSGKTIRAVKGRHNYLEAYNWFTSNEYFAGSYLFCCDLLNVNPQYLWTEIQKQYFKAQKDPRLHKKMGAINNKAGSGRYFISR